MMLKKVILTLIIVLSLSSATFGQSSGTYIIPPGSQATTSTVDSILTYLADTTHTSFFINQDSLGKIMWFSGPSDKYDSNKLKATSFICTESYWVKMESQYDTALKKVDYETKTVSSDSTGNEFWTETIDVNVVDSTEITINSPVEVTAKIYRAYDFFNPRPTELTVVGNGTNQNFSVSLDTCMSYIIAFIDSENTIINIKRIGG